MYNIRACCTLSKLIRKNIYKTAILSSFARRWNGLTSSTSTFTQDRFTLARDQRVYRSSSSIQRVVFRAIACVSMAASGQTWVPWHRRPRCIILRNWRRRRASTRWTSIAISSPRSSSSTVSFTWARRSPARWRK